ncbi:hypothetical protein CAJAP_10059 [Camponotus japonicus]
MSRVAHISPDTVVVYRISLVLEVDVVSSKVRCVTGAAVNGSADPESLRDIWPPPTDDIIFLLSVDQVQVRYFVSTGNLAGLFQVFSQPVHIILVSGMSHESRHLSRFLYFSRDGTAPPGA